MANFNNRVFGLVIIKSINSNFNADFTHQPRTLPDGTVYATDKALKYSCRHYLKNNYPDEKIFYYKKLNNDIKPNTLDETYKSFFGEFPSKKKNVSDIVPAEFFLFKYDADGIAGLVPDKPKTTGIKNYFKSLPEESNKKSYEKDFKKLTGKSIKKAKLADVQQLDFGEQEEIVFYFEENDLTFTIIDGEYEDLQEIACEIDNFVTGGLDRNKILANLLSCLDIRLFGATYAGSVNLSVHGPVQINHGVNRFTDGNIYSEPIMSPFRNSKEESLESSQTTLGSQSKLHEGHYVYHFSINPKNLQTLVKLTNSESGLIQDDVAKLKEALRCGVTYNPSSAKAGSDNELLLWVQLKEGDASKKVLPSFTEMVKVTRMNGKVQIDLSEVKAVIGKLIDAIEMVELFYIPENTVVINEPEKTIKKHLLTGESFN